MLLFSRFAVTIDEKPKMANIIDYLKWRGDISLSISPLNELDAAVVARLTYQRFELLSRVNGMTLYSALEKLLTLKDIEKKVFSKDDLTLMNETLKTGRFSTFMILDFLDFTKDETQFTALTLYEKSTHAVLVFFRGTDGTLVGLKEDFNMSFMTTIPGQKAALEYLEKVKDMEKGPVILGGHSKGGNFAVYAAAFTDGETQKRIQAVYNYDGPGFEMEILQKDGMKEITERVRTFVPQSSVIGMLLCHEEKYTIVHSTKSGIAQHNIYSWDAECTHFTSLDEVNGSSRFIDSTLKKWLKTMSKEDRGEFVEAVYAILEATNASSIREIRSHWLSSGLSMIKGIRHLSPERRHAVNEALTILFRSSKLTLLERRSEEKT